jgi:hypothetical protein
MPTTFILGGMRFAIVIFAALGAIGSGFGASPALSATSASPAQIKILETGFTYREGASPSDTTIAALVKNTSDKVALGVEWEARLTDANGTELEKVGDTLRYVFPGEQKYLGGASGSDLSVDVPPAHVAFRVVSVDRYVPVSKVPKTVAPTNLGVPGDKLLTFSNFTYRQGSYSATVVGDVTSHARLAIAASPFSADVTCGLYTNDTLVGSSYDQLTRLPPSTPVAFLDPSIAGITVDDIRCTPDEVAVRGVVTPDSDVAGLDVADTGWAITGGSSNPYVQAAAQVGNHTDKIAVDVESTFDLAAASGALVGSASQHYALPYLLPGQSAYVGGDVLVDWLVEPPASASALVSADAPFISASEFRTQYGFDPASPPVTVSNATVTQQSSVITAVVGTLTNTSNQPFTVFVQCALFRDGRAYATIGEPFVSVPPHGTAEFTASTSDVSPGDALQSSVQCDSFPRK